MKETRYFRYIHWNERDKSCFQRNSVYGDFINILRRTASDKILHNKASTIVSNPQYDEYQRGLASIVYKFFETGIRTISEDQQLVDELRKPITKKVQRHKLYSS